MLTGSTVKSEVLPTSPSPLQLLQPDGPKVNFVNVPAASARATLLSGPPSLNSAARPPSTLWSAQLSPPKRRHPHGCHLSTASPADNALVMARFGSAVPCLTRHVSLARCLAQDRWSVKIRISSNSPKVAFPGRMRGQYFGDAATRHLSKIYLRIVPPLLSGALWGRTKVLVS